MHLKHLTISGFKSFAKKSELEFSSSITAIVGPNGSGKSNVAEAFRFVLGEQSIKSMRGKRGEDLIWGGTDKVSRGNRASVTVTLNNEGRIFPVDFDEVIIERTVHRDGQNEYLINGSKVRLKDIQEVLAAANIGPTGHHIISQGEADRVLTASQKERREMIEDALGLKVYQYKKLEAEKKLKKTKENIERVASLRREVAPHLKFLAGQVKKIERSVELREQLTSSYSEYLRREDTYLAHHADRLKVARQEPADQLKNFQEQLAVAKSVLAESEKDEKREALVEAESTLSKVRSDKNELVRKSGQVEGQIDFLVRRIESEKAKVNQKSDLPIPYREVEQIVTTVEREVEKAVQKDEVSVLQRSLGDVVHTLKRFLAGIGEKGIDTTAEEEKELTVLYQQKVGLDKKLAESEEVEKKAQAEYDRVRKAIEAEQSESREAEREVFRIVGAERECENRLTTIDHELSVLERDRDEFKREMQEAVALIGRAAANYFSYKIIENGTEITAKAIVVESRDKQRERRRELERMKVRLEELGGVNDDVLKEYKDVKERDEFLVKEITDLEESVIKLESLIKDLADQLNEQFVSGIEKIGSEFNRFFVLMFGGGSAELKRIKQKPKKKSIDSEEEDLVAIPMMADDEEEESEEGIEIDVKLPNKRVSSLDMLSGGERALTSIALIFAMSQVNPPLFVILDETDAALDEANSRRYGDMIEALAKNSQLILITHNRETMSRAGILYGVTMAGDGVSKLLSVKFDEALAVAK